ncbi:MAG: GtrA family protein [bacterium]|nr:GtrA family protein [bacterium]
MKNLPAKLKNSQELNFVLIGGFNTILDFAILFGLKMLGVPELISNGFSTGITFLISFVLNKKITFQSQGKTKEELAREIVLFTIFTLFGLWGIQTGVIWLTKPVILNFIANEQIALLFAKIIATAFSMTWNFIAYKKVVFADKK